MPMAARTVLHYPDTLRSLHPSHHSPPPVPTSVSVQLLNSPILPKVYSLRFIPGTLKTEQRLLEKIRRCIIFQRWASTRYPRVLPMPRAAPILLLCPCPSILISRWRLLP